MFEHLKRLLWDNYSTKQTVAKNTFWLALAELLSRLLKLALIIYATRVLGPMGFGKFSYALSFVGLFAVLADFGLPTIFTRELAKNPAKNRDFPALFTLKMLLSLTAMIALLATNALLNQNPVIIKAILILAFSSLANNILEIFYAYFRAREKMQYEAGIKVVSAALIATLGGVLLNKIGSVNALAFSYSFVGLGLLAITILLSIDKGVNLRPVIDKVIWKKYLRQSWWLGFIMVFGVIYNQIDSVMLGIAGQLKQVGWYGASYKIMQLSLIPIAIVAKSFFPASSHARKNRKLFKKIISIEIKAGGFYALAGSASLVLISPWLVRILFGEAFAPSALALQILSLSLVGFALNNIINNLLVVSNKLNFVFAITLAGAFANIILNLVLIPRYSLYGASFATVATAYLMLGASAVLVKKNRLL